MIKVDRFFREKVIPLMDNKASPKQMRKLKNLGKRIVSIGRGSDLTFLAQIYGTDKWGEHWYTPHYQFHFQRLRNKKIKLLEIGVGGYDKPFSGGSSLRMWKRYFSRGLIFSFDIYDKSAHEEARIKIYQGSQVDAKFLDQVCNEAGSLDIIIDDGSHINEHVLFTFHHLFPKLNEGGIYVIEDTQTSYWEHYGGELEERNSKETIMGYFKSLVDGLNHEEYKNHTYKPNYYDLNISAIHFYHNLIFIYKNKNNEGSNINRST
ncbi:class I SAM-dependent methyltransferase [Echinicola marina]|uniref:class I SAM-dependent methyltransferase n=1 Tax=Echinicola marina TaxID=2859768 RepID=UPI001CF6074A|nr:class I SAM-dependent methyltransferase [Echinicola marina]UCS91981.1 class I SAM-dependent methyltransferase [Echinicola marina]